MQSGGLGEAGPDGGGDRREQDGAGYDQGQCSECEQPAGQGDHASGGHEDSGGAGANPPAGPSRRVVPASAAKPNAPTPETRIAPGTACIRAALAQPAASTSAITPAVAAVSGPGPAPSSATASAASARQARARPSWRVRSGRQRPGPEPTVWATPSETSSKCRAGSAASAGRRCRTSPSRSPALSGVASGSRGLRRAVAGSRGALGVGSRGGVAQQHRQQGGDGGGDGDGEVGAAVRCLHGEAADLGGPGGQGYGGGHRAPVGRGPPTPGRSGRAGRCGG